MEGAQERERKKYSMKRQEKNKSAFVETKAHWTET